MNIYLNSFSNYPISFLNKNVLASLNAQQKSPNDRFDGTRILGCLLCDEPLLF